jgi:hypothetical protein
MPAASIIHAELNAIPVIRLGSESLSLSYLKAGIPAFTVILKFQSPRLARHFRILLREIIWIQELEGDGIIQTTLYGAAGSAIKERGMHFLLTGSI